MGINTGVIQDKLILLEKGELTNPHEVLGIFAEENNHGKEVRAYCPNAAQVYVIGHKNEKTRVEMQFMGYGGLFVGTLGEVPADFIYELECHDHEGNVWRYVDPYQFAPTFTDENMYLFGVGNDYEIRHKLGAHFTEVDGVKGVRFAVWAPHAKRVSVIGDFNCWDGRRNPMRLLPSQGLWELFIPGIEEMAIYKYEIKTEKDVLLYKTDPYANYYELRPNNAAKVYDTLRYKWKDNKWMEKRKQRCYYKEAVSIYEVHIGSWKQHPDGSFYTYRESADELVKYVKEMGYTHVELMGISEHPFDGSWGYQVTGYFAPTSRYGTPDDFKYFIDVMHKNDIGVILDWVPAHFPKDAFSLEKFDGRALYEKDDERQANHPHWGTLIFDYSKPQVKQFLISSAINWIQDYHVDGLRVDAVASMLYLDYGRQGDFVPNRYGGKENLEAIDFFKHLNNYLYSQFGGIMMIAEESTAWPKVSYPVNEGGLGFGFKWNMGWMNDFLSYMKELPIHRKYHHQQITFSLMYAFSENFIQVLSHDEVVHGKSPMIYKMPGDQWEKFANLRVAYGYMYMHPGKKMLFMGNEFAQTKEWNEKVELDWGLLQNKEHAGILQYVKDLNKLYRAAPALWEVGQGYENFEWIDCENNEQSIISFIRKSPDNKEQLVVVINFTGEVYEDYCIGVNESAIYEEILNSDAEQYGGHNLLNSKPIASEPDSWHGKPHSIKIQIPAYGVCVFKIKAFQKAKTAKRKKAVKEQVTLLKTEAEAKEKKTKAKSKSKK